MKAAIIFSLLFISMASRAQSILSNNANWRLNGFGFHITAGTGVPTSADSIFNTTQFNGTRVLGRFFNRKDSIPIITSIGAGMISCIDTLTGQVKRILPSNLVAGTTLYTGDGTATNRTVTISGFINYLSGEVKIGSTTDQGAFSLQNASGFYNTGAVSLNAVNTGTSAMKMLVHGNDSLLYQIQIPTAAIVQDSTQEYTATFTTTDGSTNTIASIPVANSTNTQIQVTCVAVTDDGNSSFTAVKYRNFHKNSSSGLANGTLRTISADEYTGIGLTTATFTITNDGSTGGIVTVTGEIATTIQWKVKYKIVSINNSL